MVPMFYVCSLSHAFHSRTSSSRNRRANSLPHNRSNRQLNMVEVDPMVLIGIGSAMVGIIGILFYSMSKKDGNEEINTEAAPKPKATAKPSKKKSKSKTSKKADASSASESDFEVKKVVKKTALAEPVISEPEIVEEEIVSEPEVIVAPVETSTKSKKSKETPEQKASRVERQKLARAAAEDMIQPLPESVSVSATTHFDGWAVVEKSKSKKGAAATTTEPTTEEVSAEESVEAPTEVAPEEPFEQVPVAKAAEVVVEAPKPPPPPEDFVTKEFVTDARKIGLLIGPKVIN